MAVQAEEAPLLEAGQHQVDLAARRVGPGGWRRGRRERVEGGEQAQKAVHDPDILCRSARVRRRDTLRVSETEARWPSERNPAAIDSSARSPPTSRTRRPTRPAGWPLHTRILAGLGIGVALGLVVNLAVGGSHPAVAMDHRQRHRAHRDPLPARPADDRGAPGGIVAGPGGGGHRRRAAPGPRRPQVVRLLPGRLRDLGGHRPRPHQHHPARGPGLPGDGGHARAALRHRRQQAGGSAAQVRGVHGVAVHAGGEDDRARQPRPGRHGRVGGQSRPPPPSSRTCCSSCSSP